MAAADVPLYHELLWPTLQAVAELGGSASIEEIVETVFKREDFSDAQQGVLHNNGPHKPRSATGLLGLARTSRGWAC
jgi:restriction system protein